MDTEESKEETKEEEKEEVKEGENKEEVAEDSGKTAEDSGKADEDMVVLEATGESEAIDGIEAEGGDESTEPEQSMAEAMAEATEVRQVALRGGRCSPWRRRWLRL